MTMTKNKLKVLMCSEASFLSSGFGTYAKELLSRLHKTGKFTIAEFASYGFVNDFRDKDIDWIYYANAVKESDPRHKEYSSRPENQFGKWRFEKVLLDFKPDVVIDIRDYWMTAYQGVSPLRNYFHWILMPTVDSAPQQEEWIDTFLNANAVFTYSDWGANVLKEQSSGKINYISTASPGVDLNVFKIMNKEDIRSMFDLPNDALIIGSVMRNQKRKLIPELFVSFRKILDQLESNNNDLGKKLYLYLHTSYPDMGWDIPELLKDHRLSNRVLFTYICKNCKEVNCSTFTGPSKYCSKCLNKSCVFPSVTDGVTSHQLACIYNIFDLYVQYAICEGFGMPQVEAGACGIPIATVDYSAMCDIVTKLNAHPIKVKTKFKELETRAIRVYPDNDDLISYIMDYIQLPQSIKNKKRFETRQLTEKYYNWDETAKLWEDYLDKLDQSGYRAKWNEKMPILGTTDQIPNNTTSFDRTMFACNNVLKDPHKIGSHRMLAILKDIDYAFTQSSPTSIVPTSEDLLSQYLNVYIGNNNVSEKARSQNMQFDEDFITYAKFKSKQ